MTNHDRFLAHLDKSRGVVWKIAQWLNGKGYSVQVPAETRAGAHSEWREHADGGDLFVSMRVEVKNLSINFTSKEDWPFSEFIVCAKHSYDRASPKPFAYIVVSAEQSHAAIVMGANHRSWWVKSKKDRRYDGVEQDFYISRLGDVIFTELPR